MSAPTRTVLAITAVLAAGMVVPPATATPAATAPEVRPSAADPGGIGDPYYPSDGNSGYDVGSYHVKLSYFPARQTIRATTVVRARATARLATYHLDLDGLTVDAVRVGGQRATWTRSGEHELVDHARPPGPPRSALHDPRDLPRQAAQRR